MAGEPTTTISGNITADPELKTIANGATVVNFSVASTPRTYNKQSGQWEDGEPLFMRCSAWRDLATHIQASVTKGMRVIVTGALVQRSYQTQAGENRTVMEMQVEDIGPSLRYATAQVTRAQKTNTAQAPQQRQQPQQQYQPPQGGQRVPQDAWASRQQADENRAQGGAFAPQEFGATFS